LESCCEEDLTAKNAKPAKEEEEFIEHFLFIACFAVRSPMTRVLGIDFGLRRVGAALSDPTRTIATPLETYERTTRERDAHHYRDLVEAEGIERIVVGLPLHTGGGESELSRQARNFGRWLASVTRLPVHFADERYTTRQADELLREHGRRRKGKGRDPRRDMLAAQILLQAYLDAGCPESDSPALPLADDPEAAP
jgi:putative Holliday junction resolvase